jgi:hypothetical protein
MWLRVEAALNYRENEKCLTLQYYVKKSMWKHFFRLSYHEVLVTEMLQKKAGILIAISPPS